MNDYLPPLYSSSTQPLQPRVSKPFDIDEPSRQYQGNGISNSGDTYIGNTDSKANYSGNTVPNEFGPKLAEQLRPNDPEISLITSRFQNLSLLEASQKGIPDRYQNNYARYEDIPFQEEVRKLMENVTITPNTLVISATGHDIPIHAEILKHQYTQGVYRIESDGSPIDSIGNNSRNIAQADTWGNEIQKSYSDYQKFGRDAKGLFIGIDGHNSNPIDPRSLPTVEELAKLGINNIVYLIEGSPQRSYDVANADKNIQRYLSNLESNNGLRVQYRGVDPRH